MNKVKHPADQAHPKFFLPNKHSIFEYPQVALEAAARWQERYGEPIDWFMRDQIAYAIRNRLEYYDRERAELAKYVAALQVYFMRPWVELLARARVTVSGDSPSVDTRGITG